MSAMLKPGSQDLATRWRVWVAQNLMRGCSEETILQMGARDGLDQETARSLLHELKESPLLEAGRMLHRQVQKRDWVLRIYAEMARAHSKAEVVERVERPDLQDFIDRFYAVHRPVILTGIMDHWPALSRWTPAYLKERYGEIMVEVQLGRAADPFYELNPHAYRKKIPFGEFIDRIVQAGESNDTYMTARNWARHWVDFIRIHEDIGDLAPYTPATDDFDRGIPWFGPKGTVTPLHHDTCNIFVAQVRGRKRFRLITPAELPNLYNFLDCWSLVDLDNVDPERYPLFQNVRLLDCTIGPGEVIYLPAGYWHHVTALDLSLSISFRANWFGPPVPISYDTTGVM